MMNILQKWNIYFKIIKNILNNLFIKYNLKLNENFNILFILKDILLNKLGKNL